MSEEWSLDQHAVAPEPLDQFARWYAEAVAARVPEPEAMCLATVVDDVPSARMVLLKGVDDRGFVFFTNYTSQKGRELAANPRAALVWRWYDLQRQVRVVGSVEPVDPVASDDYFATRARGSQLSAWASPQSEVLADRDVLDAGVAAVEARFAGRPVPRPHWWGGFRVVPVAVEFWQGRADRLHDRVRYAALAAGSGPDAGSAPDPPQGWRIERLAP